MVLRLMMMMIHRESDGSKTYDHDPKWKRAMGLRLMMMIQNGRAMGKSDDVEPQGERWVRLMMMTHMEERWV